MIIYWIIFIFLLFLAITESPRLKEIKIKSILEVRADTVIVFIILSLFIGLRYDVGSDWGAYLHYLSRASESDFLKILSYKDPGYQIINYVASILGLGIWSVNLFCASVFTYCLLRFCSSLPRPHLALLCSFPYLIIVVSMGYTRQAVAIGIVMVALLSNNFLHFIIKIAIAALFHKSALLLIPCVLALSSKNKKLTFLMILFSIILGYFVLVRDSVDDIMYTYIDKQYQSSGAFIRVMMCAIPSIIFLFYRKHLNLNEQFYKLWSLFSLISLVSLGLLFIFSSTTTIIDRIALYCLPIQLVVFSFLPQFFKARQKFFCVIIICLYCFVIQFVWMNFANNAGAWIPYKFYPIYQY